MVCRHKEHRPAGGLRQAGRGRGMGEVSKATADHLSGTAHHIKPFAGRRVLAADDSSANHDILKHALGRLGIAVTCVETGDEAVAAVSEHAYDLVFMDGSMPEMDGFEAARRIRKMEAETGRTPVPIIALTAHVFSRDDEAWREAGMSDLLAKPFSLVSIRTCLERWLEPTASAATERAVADLRHRKDAVRRILPTRRAGLLDVTIIDAIREISAPADKLLAQVVGFYLDLAPQYVRQISQAYTEDMSVVAEAAHALKALSRNIGARRIGDLAGEIELRARAGAPTEAETLHALETDLAPTLAALSRLASKKGRPARRTRATVMSPSGAASA